MKFTILYGRKFRVAAYDMLEISMAHEFDSTYTEYNVAFEVVKRKVDEWIEKESDRLLEKSVPRPKP